MWKTILSLLLLLVSAPVLGRDEAGKWIEVRSQHFVVATNSNEKQARRVADQFERMRSIFHALFPKLQIDPSSPIIVLAVKSDRDFRALEPEGYLAKGQLKLGGLFLRAMDKNYVLMHLDAEGEHPYEVIYHEYTHLLFSKDADWLPLWLNEGLAEFYQNTDIRENEVLLGQASVANIELLREPRLLPLQTLFAVDTKSPYYHEENKGSIFYAESWALTHFIYIGDAQHKTHRLGQYVDLLAKKVDPLIAATTAFGDLHQLELNLNSYVHQGSFQYFKVKTSTDVDESSIKAEPLIPAQADALRADFLAYNGRTKDARALLDQVLQKDPNNVSAHETMGFLEFRGDHLDEAKQWYAQAVQLDSQSYLAYYYFAAISMRGTLDASQEAQVESSLRRAIKLNPSFAPSYNQLAIFLGRRHRNLDEARMMAVSAVSLDPGNLGYRVNVANILLAMERGQDAVNVLRIAAKLAKTPQESQMVANDLAQAELYAQSQKEMAERRQNITEAAEPSDSSPDNTDAMVPRLAKRTSLPAGPHRFMTGVLKNVQCRSTQIDLTVQSGSKTTAFHSDNFYIIQYSTLGFPATGELNPCKDLEGIPAKVEYVEPASKTGAALVVSIELHK